MIINYSIIVLKQVTKYIFRFLVLVFFFLGKAEDLQACSPLNVPSATTFTVVGSNLVISVSNTSSWLNCQNVIDLEFACNTAVFSGAVVDTYTSPAQAFSSSPYTYNQQSINIGNLCPGTVYKFRIRERNSNSTTASSWSSTYTFQTLGVFVTPVMFLSANPSLICPPAPVQLQAAVSPTCGRSPVTYAWFPTTGLSNPNIANPIANVSSPITYTCIAYGGASGCWAATASIFINVGTGPPVPGIAQVTPTTLCVYNGATLSTTAFTGNIQWQSSASSTGPWNNIPGANTPSFAIASVSASTCYQAVFTSCSGATVASNVTCAFTNTVPTLVPSTGCSGSLSSINFSYIGTSGTPTNVVWSPPPASVNGNSTTAYYPASGNYYMLAFFGDGCISSNSISLLVPNLSVNMSTVSCAALASGTITTNNINGPINFSWLPSTQTGSAVSGLFPGTYTCQATYSNNSCYSSSVVSLVSNVPLTTTISASPSVLCPNALTGTASIVIAGGSGNTTYTWTNANLSLHTPSVSGLIAGTHSITILDQVTFCSHTETFLINGVPNLSLTITPNSPTICAGSNATLTASGNGGTPGYTYTWTNGPQSAIYITTEPVAGPYVYTVSSSDVNNCSITQTVTLTYINLPTITVVNANICPGKTGTLTASGASTYTWSNNPAFTGSTYTASPNVNTFYNVSGSSFGCSSNAIGQIQMLPVPVPVISSNNPVCNGFNLNFTASGGTSYAWSGPLGFQSNTQLNSIANTIPAQSGAYVVTVTAANSCTAFANSNFTVFGAPPIAVVGSTVCSTGSINLTANSSPGATFVWAGPAGFTSNAQYPIIGSLNSNKSGYYNVVVTSAEGCTAQAAAHVTVTQLPTAMISSNGPICTGAELQLFGSGGFSYNWNGPNGFNSNLQNPTITATPYAGGGIYNLQATTGPCIANTSYPLTVWALPTVIASNGGNVCETKTVQLNCQTGGPVVSYAWQGPLFSNPFQSPTRHPASLMHSGEYTITVTDANGCQQFATTSVTVLQNPNVAATGATVCLFQPAVISANGANSYYWEGPNGFTSYIGTPTIGVVNPSNVGTYTVTGKAVNTCTTTVTIDVQYKNLPIPSLTVSPSSTICLNASIQLEGSGGYSYIWYGPENIFLEGQKVSISASNFKFEGTYTLVAVDQEGCHDAITTDLHIFPLPDGGIAGELSGCAPHCKNYRFLPLDNNSKLSATWQINKSSYPANFFKCFNAPGSYSVTGFFYDSLTTCSSSKTFTVKVHPSPSSNFDVVPLNPIENLDEAIFNNRSDGLDLEKFTWHFANKNKHGETEIYSGERITKVFGDAGIYTVAMITENIYGCTDTIVKSVEVAPDFFIFVPNVFTPNGDRTNEKFMAVTRGVDKFELSVYNRWGHRIFYTLDPNEGWDGRYNDLESKSDIYTWKIDVRSIHGEQRNLSGHVTLYR